MIEIKDNIDLKKIIDDLLHYIGNDECCLNIELKNKFRGLLLYLVKYERGFKGYCSNEKCRCQTKNIIKEYLKDKELVKFINGYGMKYDKAIMELIGE